MALLALATGSVRDRPRPARGAARHRRLRRRAVLRRRRADAGHLGALGGRGARSRDAAAFKPYVVPIATGILVALFVIQRHGTGVVGVLFGPVCALWFACARARSASGTSRRCPRSSRRSTRRMRCSFATGHGVASFVVLGSVLLAITGAEALYADMGHFGKRAIRVAWFGVVAPALVLNYFGQGALLIARPEGDREPVLPRRSRRGRSTRWSRSRPRRRSSRRRRRSPARTR